MDIYDKYDNLNAILRDESDARWVKAAKELAVLTGQKARFSSLEPAQKFVTGHFYWLLDQNSYLEAAVLAWGLGKINPRPQCVVQINENIQKHHHLLIQGASGLSKSFYCTAWLLMDWARDPQYTTVRVASMSQAHLQDNLFSHLLDLYGSSVIRLPGESDRNLFIGMDTKVGYGCIRGITFPKEEKVTGRFLGFKMQNRPKPHPIFGDRSRIRVFLDEFNKMTSGVVGDLNSIESQIYDTEHVKIIAAYNPSDQTHIAHRVSEPVNGWDSVEPEKAYSWDTKWGWHLLRLDGLVSENVVAKTVIHRGLLTYEAFLAFLSKGDSSADYWTYGRGWWPVAGAYNSIFSRESLQGSRKIPIYVREVTELAGVDSALINDGTVLTKARYGLAMGYTDRYGIRQMFPRARHICYIEHQITIPGAKDQWELAQKIRDVCQSLGVSAEWLAIDSTGAMSELKNNLHRIFGGVLGVVSSEGATERKMLADDIETADLSYANVASEMWFTTKRWIERGVMFISPKVPESPLFDELTSRRRRTSKQSGGKVQVETKAEYRARGHAKSPDFSDSLNLIAHLIRARHSVIPGSEADSSDSGEDEPTDYFSSIPGMPARASGRQGVDEQISLEEIGDEGLPDPEMDEDDEEPVEASW